KTNVLPEIVEAPVGPSSSILSDITRERRVRYVVHEGTPCLRAVEPLKTMNSPPISWASAWVPTGLMTQIGDFGGASVGGAPSPVAGRARGMGNRGGIGFDGRF